MFGVAAALENSANNAVTNQFWSTAERRGPQRCGCLTRESQRPALTTNRPAATYSTVFGGNYFLVELISTLGKKIFNIIVNLVRPLHRYQHILENAFRYLRRFSPSLISSECTNLVFGIFSPPALALGGFFYALARFRIATAVRWPIGQLRSLFPREVETLLADFPICPIIRLHIKAHKRAVQSH